MLIVVIFAGKPFWECRTAEVNSLFFFYYHVGCWENGNGRRIMLVQGILKSCSPEGVQKDPLPKCNAPNASSQSKSIPWDATHLKQLRS